MTKTNLSKLEEMFPCAVIRLASVQPEVEGDRDLAWDLEENLEQVGYSGLSHLMEYAKVSGNWKSIDSEFDGLVSRTAEANEKYKICGDCSYLREQIDNIAGCAYCPKQVAPELFKQERK